MEIQPPRSGSLAPPPGTGERGFDKLQNPLGMAVVAVSLILFALICFHGSRWVRNISKAGEEDRRRLREHLEREGKPLP